MTIRPFRALSDRINKFFSIHEMECNDGLHSILINEEVLFFTQRLLTKFRIWYNRPIVPSSWFRTITYNLKIGGAKGSRHLRGVAVDIHFPTHDHDGTPFADWSNARREEFLRNCREKWYDILQEDGMTGGFGYYDWGFHLDAGNDTEYFRFWDYRGSKEDHYRIEVLDRTKITLIV